MHHAGSPALAFFFFVISVCYLELKDTPLLQVNPDMIPQFENAGLSFVGRDETGRRMEVSFCGRQSMCILQSIFVDESYACYILHFVFYECHSYLNCRLLNCHAIHILLEFSSIPNSSLGQGNPLPFS